MSMRSTNFIKMADVLREGDNVIRGLGDTLIGIEGARTRLLEARLSLNKAINMLEEIGLDILNAEFKEKRDETQA